MLRFADHITILGDNKKQLNNTLNGINHSRRVENANRLRSYTKKEQMSQEYIKMSGENFY